MKNFRGFPTSEITNRLDGDTCLASKGFELFITSQTRIISKSVFVRNHYANSFRKNFVRARIARQRASKLNSINGDVAETFVSLFRKTFMRLLAYLFARNKRKKKVCLTQFHIRNSQHKSALAREELRKNVIERFHDKSSRLIVETGTLCFLGGKFVCSNYSFRPRTSLEIRFSYTKKKVCRVGTLTVNKGFSAKDSCGRKMEILGNSFQVNMNALERKT